MSKPQEPAVMPSKVKESDSNIQPILRTCESVERHVEEDRFAKDVQKPTPEETEVEVMKARLILDPVEKVEEVVDNVIAETQTMAGGTKPAEMINEQQPKSHPVSIGTLTPPPSMDPPGEKEDQSSEETVEEQKPVSDTEEKRELAAIETKADLTTDPKPDTPSKYRLSMRWSLRVCFRNVYSPSVLQELKEKNKEPLPDMGAGPWLEGSEVESPMKESLPRRGSSSKLGSRSSSYQGLTRRNSSNGRASKQAKSDPEEVFHVSSKKRIYSMDYMQVRNCICVLCVRFWSPEFAESMFRQTTISRKHAVHERRGRSSSEPFWI